MVWSHSETLKQEATSPPSLVEFSDFGRENFLPLPSRLLGDWVRWTQALPFQGVGLAPGMWEKPRGANLCPGPCSQRKWQVAPPSLLYPPPPPFGFQTLSFLATEDQSPRSVPLPRAKVREAGSL